MTIQGLELVRAVIEKVRAQGFRETFGERLIIRANEPTPVSAELLDQARFDGDIPLTPCLKEWLAFDGSLFHWFGPRGIVVGERVGELTDERDVFAPFERTLPRLCYTLPFSNMEYVHFIYPSLPDSSGELPVLCAETENQQVLVTHPGIDTFLGYHAGLLEKDWRKQLRGRIVEHQQQTLGGKQALVWGEGDYVPPEPTPEDLPAGITKMDEATYMMQGDDPLPPGFRVLREAQNPFTKKRMRFLTKS